MSQSVPSGTSPSATPLRMLGHHVADIAQARRAMRARQRDQAAQRVIAAGELFRCRVNRRGVPKPIGTLSY